MLPTWTYSKSDTALYVNMFVGSTVTVRNVAGTNIEMVQATNYPFGGEVSITVYPEEEKKLSINIRVPDRDVSTLYSGTPAADGIISIAVNGTKITPPVEKGYATITRNWKAGDRIDLVLPMRVQRITASDQVAATRGQVALRYGPLVYCVEDVDQNLDNALAPDAALKVRWRDDLPGGVPVIVGAWADGSPLTAIPYYARNNRPADSGEKPRPARSSVWLKADNATPIPASLK